MDAKARRERRQQNILSGANDRLSKISKTTNPDAIDYKAPATTEKAGSESLSAELTPPPTTDHFHQSQGIPSIPSELQNDPLFKMLSEMQNRSSMDQELGSEPLNNMSDPFAAFNGLLGNNGMFDKEQKMEESKTIRFSDILWSLIHILGSILIAVYSVFSHSRSLLWSFCTLQIILHSTRFLVEKGSPPANSTIATIAGYLPNPFKSYLITVARYIRFACIIAQDVSLVIFAVGLLSSF